MSSSTTSGNPIHCPPIPRTRKRCSQSNKQKTRHCKSTHRRLHQNPSPSKRPSHPFPSPHHKIPAQFPSPHHPISPIPRTSIPRPSRIPAKTTNLERRTTPNGDITSSCPWVSVPCCRHGVSSSSCEGGAWDGVTSGTGARDV